MSAASSNTEFHLLCEMIPAPALLLDAQSTPVGWNRAYLDMLGIDDQIMVERQVEHAIHPDEIDIVNRIIENSAVDTPIGPTDMRVRHGDGSWVRASWMHRLDGATGLVMIVAMDVTARHAQSHKFMIEARTDKLTGLSNRTRLMEMMEEHRSAGSLYLFALLDLDRFKRINDTWGHQTGDHVLIVLAKRLVKVVPKGSLVARLGGDEFVVMVPEPVTSGPETLASELALVLAQPISDSGRRITISGSVGVVEATPEMTTTEVLRRADFSLYEAKADPTRKWVIANSEAFQRQQVQRQLEDDLGAAIGTGQFRAHVQPIVRLSDRTTVGLEALARWHHPTRGVRPASEFIETAEGLGLVADIGSDVRQHALSQHQSAPLDTQLSLNLSALEVSQSSLVDELLATTEIYGIENHRVVLEVTESTLISNLSLACSTLESLRSYGFRVALDDFGAGYASLSYLATFPLDQIKLDRSILAARRLSAGARDLTGAAIDFIHRLGHELVVEGVETEEDHDYLVNHGVELAQGWLYGRPAPIEDALKFFDSNAAH